MEFLAIELKWGKIDFKVQEAESANGDCKYIMMVSNKLIL
jgi:hypothetical protein